MRFYKKTKNLQTNPQTSFVMLLFVFCQPLASGTVVQGVGMWKAHTVLDSSTSKTKKKKKKRFYDQSRRSHLPALGPYVPPAHFQCNSSAWEQLDNLNFWLWEEAVWPRMQLPVTGSGLPSPAQLHQTATGCWTVPFSPASEPLRKSLSPPRCVTWILATPRF